MAMVNESTYTSLLAWLCPAMEAEYKRLYSKGKDGGKLRGLGKYDKNVYQGRVDRLTAVVFSWKYSKTLIPTLICTAAIEQVERGALRLRRQPITI